MSSGGTSGNNSRVRSVLRRVEVVAYILPWVALALYMYYLLIHVWQPTKDEVV